MGWCDTNSAVIRHAGVDVWVIAKETPAFDYGTEIPRHRIQQVRNTPGVELAQAVFVGWNYWQRPDGRRVTIELVGLDDDCIAGPWDVQEGRVAAVHEPTTVIIDSLYLKDLGVQRIGDEVEILGKRAIVGGISRNVRTFTAAPWVFTSLESAIKYDGRTGPDQITYVVVRCKPGYAPETVRNLIAAFVPSVEVLTTHEFAARTVRYWMLETGVGITVVITAVLGLVIGTIIVSQTLYAITNDHISDYATLLAIGVSRRQLISVIVAQSLMMGITGICVGAALFYYAAIASARTPIPLETTPLIFSGLVVTTLVSCVFASTVSIRSLFCIDPVTVFKA